MNEEIKASVISPDELSELDKLLHEVIDLEAVGPQNVDSNEAALAADKTKALDTRKKALKHISGPEPSPKRSKSDKKADTRAPCAHKSRMMSSSPPPGKK